MKYGEKNIFFLLLHQLAQLILLLRDSLSMDSVMQRIMPSPYEPIHDERDIEEAVALAKKRAVAGQGQQHHNTLETVPEEEDNSINVTKEDVALGDRYDGSDTDVDLGGSGPEEEEEEEETETSSLFGSGALKLKRYATAAWGGRYNPVLSSSSGGGGGGGGIMSTTRRLVLNAPVVITLSLFFNFLLILILGMLAWKMSPPRTGGRPPDELVYSESYPSWVCFECTCTRLC